MSEAGDTRQTLTQPVGIELPVTSRARNAARLASTTLEFGRHLAPPITRMLLKRNRTNDGVPRAVRRAFESLGATYVKFGQFVGSAPDLVGTDVADEFRSCLDTGPAVPFEDIRSIVEHETGRRLDEMFGSFEPVPIAAASLAVVHRARLQTGEEVAVKILRPGIERVVATDLALLRGPARFAARQGSDTALDVLSYLTGLREQVAEELDLRNEARSMDYFGPRFEEFELSLIVVPRVYREFSGRRVLTMQFLEGAAIDDLASVQESGLDPRPFVRQLMQAWVLSAIYDGAFHADIHAGNILLTRDGRLGIVDWGIVARLDPDTHRLVRRLLEAAVGVESAWDDITAHFTRIQGDSLRNGLGLTDEQIARLVRRTMEPVLTAPVRDVSMASLFGTSEDAIVVATGKPPQKRSLSQQWQLLRKKRRSIRLKIAQGVVDSSFQRASFLAAKQVVYLERYWKMYLADEAILGDKAFVSRVLAESLAREQAVGNSDDWMLQQTAAERGTPTIDA